MKYTIKSIGEAGENSDIVVTDNVSGKQETFTTLEAALDWIDSRE